MAKVKNANYFHAQVKELKASEDGVIRIRGFASTPTQDRYNDIVEPEAFKGALETYMKNPQILLMHDPYETIGLATSAQVTQKGLIIEAELTPDGSENINVALTRVQQGKLRTLSIGYRPLEMKFVNKDSGEELNQEEYFDLPWSKMKEYNRFITKLDLVEISIVSTPANADSVFTVQKSLAKYFDALEAERKEAEGSVIYNINAKDMPKPKDISKKNANDELENNNEVENEEVETDNEEEVIDDVEEKDDEEVVEDEGNDGDEAEEGEDEGEDTDEKTDDSEDSEDDDAEKSGEDPDAEEEAVEKDGEGSDDGEADDEEAEEEVEDAEGEDDDAEKSVIVEADGAKTFIRNLGNILLSNEDKKEVSIDVKKLVNVEDAKAVTELCQKLLALTISQQKQISDLKATLDVTPNKKALITLRHYAHEEDQVQKKEVEDKRKVSQNALKSIFASRGIRLKD